MNGDKSDSKKSPAGNVVSVSPADSGQQPNNSGIGDALKKVCAETRRTGFRKLIRVARSAVTGRGKLAVKQEEMKKKYPLSEEKSMKSIKEVMDKLVKKLELQAAKGDGWILEKQDAKSAAQFLHYEDFILLKIDSFLGKLCDKISREKDKASYNRLAVCYLRYFDRLRNVKQLVDFLRDKACSLGNGTHKSGHEKYFFFEPAKCLEILTSAILSKCENENFSVVEFLKGVGIRSKGAINSGIGKSCFREFCERNMPQKKQQIVFVMNWAVMNQNAIGSNNNAFLHRKIESYWDCRVELAHCLLRAWTKESPSPDIRDDMLIPFFLKNYGDPRKDGNLNWKDVEKDKVMILKKWLNIKSLENFLKVVDATVRSARHQWEQRRKFWLAYINRYGEYNCWPVFGKHAADYVDNADIEISEEEFGRIEKGANSDQSVLLIAVRNIIIADWSHNGKVRFWKSEGRHPKFRREKYSADELRLSSVEEIIHIPNYWQGAVAKQIEDLTGDAPPPEVEQQIQGRGVLRGKIWRR